MNENLDRARAVLRAFVRAHYSDEQLAAALAHARDGKLCYQSCCCVVGIPTAGHALQGFNAGSSRLYSHLASAYELRGARAADAAFCVLGRGDGERRRRLIPILLGEIRRRSETKRNETEEHARAETVPV